MNSGNVTRRIASGAAWVAKTFLPLSLLFVGTHVVYGWPPAAVRILIIAAVGPFAILLAFLADRTVLDTGSLARMRLNVGATAALFLLLPVLRLLRTRAAPSAKELVAVAICVLIAYFWRFRSPKQLFAENVAA